MCEQEFIKVEAAPTFNWDLCNLSKKYRSIRSDVQHVIEQLQQGELPGDQISGTDCIVFKVRILNSNIKKGKSGGYRLIYYVKIATNIILLTIYTESEQVDITASEIKSIISEYEQGAAENDEDI